VCNQHLWHEVDTKEACHLAESQFCQVCVHVLYMYVYVYRNKPLKMGKVRERVLHRVIVA